MQRSNHTTVTTTRTPSRARLVAAILTPLCAAAAVTLAAPATAEAGTSCRSEWVKFKDFFDQNGPKIAKGICQLFNKDDAEAGKKCLADYEAAKAKVDETIHKYNAKAGDTQWKIGPRGLGEGKTLSGTLLAQRTFAGPPVMSDTYRLDLRRTGGKATKGMKGTVCFVDENGDVSGSTTTFTVDRGRPNYAHTFSGVAGLTPVILLEKPWGTNGHQYTIRAESGGEAGIVKKAREAAAGQGSGQQAQCSNPCPHGGRYDGANCYVGTPPSGTKAFLYADNYYYTPQGLNTCPKPGSRFDGANCFVSAAPKQAQPFIWSNNWYYKACM